MNNNNDITTTAIALIHYLQGKGYKSYIINKVANLILLNKTQKNIIGTILTSATDSELGNMFTQYSNKNGQMILHFGLYDFLMISTNDINKYRKHQPTIIDTLIYDGDDFIDYKNAKQYTLDGIISLNEELNTYTFNYIITQKALYNYTIDIDTISKMCINKELFNAYSPAQLLTKPFAIQTLEFLHEYDLYEYSKYKKQYDCLYKNLKLLQILLQKEFTVVEIYYLMLKTKKGLSKKQQFKYEWIENNYNIINADSKTFRLNLINAIFDNETLLEQGMPLLRELITSLYKIRKIKKDINIKQQDIIYNMCCRPYFPKQLHLTDRQIITLYGNTDLETKKQILLHISQLDNYPDDLYKTLEEAK